VSRATHAIARASCGDDIESVGKSLLQQSGKDRVNKNDEETFRRQVPRRRGELREHISSSLKKKRAALGAARWSSKNWISKA
jgi:hypothetical protein